MARVVSSGVWFRGHGEEGEGKDGDWVANAEIRNSVRCCFVKQDSEEATRFLRLNAYWLPSFEGIASLSKHSSLLLPQPCGMQKLR